MRTMLYPVCCLVKGSSFFLVFFLVVSHIKAGELGSEVGLCGCREYYGGYDDRA